MSNQTLRQALESQLEFLPTMIYENGYPVQAMAKVTLLDLLAQHPDEPAPRPVLDRERVAVVLARLTGVDTREGRRLADAILELARPMPTREQISEAILAAWLVQAELKVEASPVEHCRTLADAVLALLNGSES